MGVGLRLKMALREKRMTIKELSAQSGVSLNTLYSITKRDTENVDDVIIRMISKTLGLSDFFFLGIPPFDDLDFLQRNKERILVELKNQGFISKNIETLSDISNYDFWKILSNACAIYEDETGHIQVVCEPVLNYDPNSDVGADVDTLLDFFTKLEPSGRKLVIEYAELLASNPGFLLKKSNNKTELAYDGGQNQWHT